MCASDGYDATFTWSGTTGVNNDLVSSSANPFTLPEGPFDLTCTAEVNELTCTETTQTTLVESAYSMYRKQCDTFLTTPMLMTLFVG